MTTIISLPLHPSIIPLQQKARGAISEVHWIYGGCFHQEFTSQGSPTYPYSSNRKYMLRSICFSPTGPLLVLSTQKNTQMLLAFTRLFDLYMKIHLQNYQEKKATHTIQNGYVTTNCLPFTAFHPSRKTITLKIVRSNISNEPLKAHLYVTLFLQTVNIYFSPTSPFLVLSTPEKHYKLFGFTKTV